MTTRALTLPGDLTSTETKVLSLITEQAWLDLTCSLVPAGQPEAENPLDPDDAPAREEGAALVVADILKGMGFSIDFVAKGEDRPIVQALQSPAG